MTKCLICLNNAKYSGYCIKHIIKDVKEINSLIMFREAIHHQRGPYKTEAKRISEYFFNNKDIFKNIKTFIELYLHVGKIFKENNFFGNNKLFHYDISSALSKYLNIPILNVYFQNGKGTHKYLIKLKLNNYVKNDKIGNYIDSEIVMTEIINAKIDIKKDLGEINKLFIGDELETYLCYLSSL